MLLPDFLIQVYKVASLAPKPLDTSNTDRLRSVTCRTASAMNSSEYFGTPIPILLALNYEYSKCLPFWGKSKPLSKAYKTKSVFVLGIYGEFKPARASTFHVKKRVDRNKIQYYPRVIF